MGLLLPGRLKNLPLMLATCWLVLRYAAATIATCPGLQMQYQLSVIRDLRVLRLDAPGTVIASEADARGLLVAARAGEAAWVAIASRCLDPAFFDVHNGLAARFIQCFEEAGVPLAIVGDIGRLLGAGEALKAFVFRANRGRAVCFLNSAQALETRLGWAH